jgi:CBS domain containing-hemolysin-like protein
MNPWLGIALVVVFVLLNGFFVAAEFALVKVRDTQLSPLDRKGNKGAKLARDVVGKLESYLNACQLGITLSSLALGWVGEPALVTQIEPLLGWMGVTSPAVAHSAAFALSFGVLSILHILFGELVPKSIGIRQAVPVAVAAARPLIVFRALFIWFLAFMDVLSNWVLRALKMPPIHGGEGALSEEEIRLIIQSEEISEELHERKRALLMRVLRSTDRPVSLAMVPRRDMAYLCLDHPMDETLAHARRHAFSRFPVVTEDDLDKIVGYVHVRDLFFTEPEDALALEPKLRSPLFVPKTATVANLLDKMSAERVHLAIVVDDYGGTSGLVTLEDLLEELVGEIQDEFDNEPAMITELAGGAVRIAGTMALVDAAAHLGIELDDEEDDDRTIGGFVIDRLGRMPKAGDKVDLADRVVEIAVVHRRRIVQLLVTPRPPAVEED